MVTVSPEAIVIDRLPEVAVWLALSVTIAVNVNVPVALGLPVIAPVEAVNVKPVGSDPVAMLQLYGGVPPVAVSVPPV